MTAIRPFAFTRGLDYASIVATAEKVAWTVDEVVGDRRFDASKPIVPAAWVGVDDVPFLDDDERRTLNHCRAFSYAHLLGNFEEFIPHHLDATAQRTWHGDRAHLRSLLRFEEEERKHQELFRRAEGMVEQACGHSFDRYFDEDGSRLRAFTEAVLAFPLLPRCLTLLALELGTQRAYVEATRQRGIDAGSPVFVHLLTAHWVEEAQHTKWGMLEVAGLARGQTPADLRDALGQIAGIGALVDVTLAGQTAAEIATFQRVTGRCLDEREAATLHDVLHRSLAAIVTGVALGHPTFAKVALELSPAGAATIGIGAR